MGAMGGARTGIRLGERLVRSRKNNRPWANPPLKGTCQTTDLGCLSWVANETNETNETETRIARSITRVLGIARNTRNITRFTRVCWDISNTIGKTIGNIS